MSVVSQIKWLNAAKDGRPVHMQQVLVCVNGVYHVTLYDEQHKKFRLMENPRSFFSPENQVIYWTEVIDPKELE
jgi:hypothetical protein